MRRTLFPVSLYTVRSDMSAEAAAEPKTYGSLPSPLGFGDVVCQTASGAGGGAFRIIGVPQPASVQFLIDKERDAKRNRLGGAPGTATTAV